VTETLVLACGQHGDERPTWMYVEADAATGVADGAACSAASPSRARLRLALDLPADVGLHSCGHSIAEVAAGLSVPDGQHVDWVVLGARCVECGQVGGLTDVVLDQAPLASVVVGL
jgi:hypothetical protein